MNHQWFLMVLQIYNEFIPFLYPKDGNLLWQALVNQAIN